MQRKQKACLDFIIDILPAWQENGFFTARGFCPIDPIYLYNYASLIARKIPVPLEKQINFSVAILVCKQFLKGKIRPAQIFEILFRVYLKTPNVTGSEEFLR